MSKFNKENSMKTVNKSGHEAYSMCDKERLVTQVLCTFFNEEKFYGDTSKEIVATAEKLAKTDPKFISNLAIYARKEYHLRSVAHVLTCIVAKTVESKPYIKRTVTGVVERADDLNEILACYLSMYGKPIPNGLKKALATNLKRFNEFQLSKYNGGEKAVKFKDILKLTHVKPDNAEQEKLFNKVLNDNLETAVRWETELSTKGNTKEVWEELIEKNQVGYMAALRNLRNILNAQPSNIQKIYDKLTNKFEVLRSKQLPFRFSSAYKEIKDLPKTTNKVLDVLEKAIEHSVSNMPRLSGKTVIAFDVSGSMDSSVSSKSKVRCCDISSLLAVLSTKICDEYMVFSFDTKLYKTNIGTNAPILEEANKLARCYGGTSLELPLQYMINNNIVADRLILISDNVINSEWSGGYKQTCQALADKYRKTVNKNLWVHAIDLQGYGTQQFMGGKTNIIAGWSEKVLEFIKLAEDGIDTQVKRIENYGGND